MSNNSVLTPHISDGVDRINTNHADTLKSNDLQDLKTLDEQIEEAEAALDSPALKRLDSYVDESF